MRAWSLQGPVSSSQVTTGKHATRRRRTLPAGLALTGAALAFTSLYLAAGALTPLLVLYRQQWDFPPSLLTLAFAVYAIGFLAAVLTLGSLSDHVGRSPVLVRALVVQLVSNVLFLVASDIGWVIAGRIVQGVSSGAATAAFTAVLVELAPAGKKRLGTILGSAGLTGGLGAGSLLAGLAIQLTPTANVITFTVLIVLTVLGTVAVVLSPETMTRTPGALRPMVPHACRFRPPPGRSSPPPHPWSPRSGCSPACPEGWRRTWSAASSTWTAAC
ncbi:MFS transporter [Nonomuraea fuscirosea]|uniref:MFS transporter n=1 Tax=Nonomuraea fuscirosea TaxID=1291556 RepID=UPI0033F7EC98